MTRCKSLLFFPVVSTSVPREYRFHFQPPFRVNSPSLYVVRGYLYWLFYNDSVHFKCALLPNITLCVVCCTLHLMPSRSCGQTALWFLFRAFLNDRRFDLKAHKVMRPGCASDEKTPLLHVCVFFFFCALPVYLSCFSFFCCMFNVEFYVLYVMYVSVDMQMLKGERRLWHSCSFPHFNIIWRTQKGGKKMI